SLSVAVEPGGRRRVRQHCNLRQTRRARRAFGISALKSDAILHSAGSDRVIVRQRKRRDTVPAEFILNHQKERNVLRDWQQLPRARRPIVWREIERVKRDLADVWS